MRRKQIATGDDGQPAGQYGQPAPDPRSRAPRPGPPAQPASNGGHWTDVPDETPPWERESGRIPVPSNLPRAAGKAPNDAWGWNESLEASLPGVSIGDTTGTGKIAAVVPLTARQSGWSKGVRAPAAAAVRSEPPDDFKEQASAHLRAINRGNLARATAIVTAAMLASRVLGVFRTALFAATFGPTVQADAFTNAFALPDAIFTIVAGGALASAFIPVFADYLIDKRDRRTAWHVASSALNLSLASLTLLGILGFIFAPEFLRLTLPVYFNGPCTSTAPCEGDLIVQLTRIMLLQPIFLGGATVAVAILQARQHFLLPALGQVIYTASLIGGILATLIDNYTGIFGRNLGINGPAYGVVAGAALQFLIQIPGLLQSRMAYRLSFDLFHPGVREMIRLMVPRMLNAALLFVSVFINRNLLALASNGDDGTVYGYVTAFSLVLLPIGIFGMAISQAAFPTLAAFVASGDWQRLRDTIMRTIRGVTYLAVPSSLGLIVLAQPLSKLLIAHHAFDPTKIGVVSDPLIYFAIGLLGLSLVEILTRSFYALHDTRTAVEVSLLQFMFVIGLSIVLLNPMGAKGLALATSLGALGEALVLLLLLRPRLGGLDLKGLGTFTLNVLAASVVSALAAYFIYTLGLVVLHEQKDHPVYNTVIWAVQVLAAVGAGTVVYFGFAHFLGIDDVVPLSRILRRILRR
jgi:putative peptidoglycan lipid II flippase